MITAAQYSAASDFVSVHQFGAGPKTATLGVKHIRKLGITSRVFETQEWKDAHGNKRQERRGEKTGRQLQGEGWRGSGDGGSGVRGGLQAKRHVNGERRASLTRSLARHFFSFVPCSCCCRFSLPPNPPSLPGPPSVFLFCFLWLAKLAEVHCFSWRVLEGLKIRAAVLHCKILNFIKYLRQGEIGDRDSWQN